MGIFDGLKEAGEEALFRQIADRFGPKVGPVFERILAQIEFLNSHLSRIVENTAAIGQRLDAIDLKQTVIASNVTQGLKTHAADISAVMARIEQAQMAQSANMAQLIAQMVCLSADMAEMRGDELLRLPDLTVPPNGGNPN